MNKSSKRRIKLLEKTTREIANKFLPLADNWLRRNCWLDYTFEITEGLRTVYRQAGLYSIGRQYVNWEGWKVIDKKKVVTWTMESNHIKKKAFDCALFKDKMYYWPDPKIPKNENMWIALAGIGKELGLHPGAFWKNSKPDYPHFSTTPG